MSKLEVCNQALLLVKQPPIFDFENTTTVAVYVSGPLPLPESPLEYCRYHYGTLPRPPASAAGRMGKSAHGAAGTGRIGGVPRLALSPRVQRRAAPAVGMPGRKSTHRRCAAGGAPGAAATPRPPLTKK